jgi:outer membrane immunogenic protein
MRLLYPSDIRGHIILSKRACRISNANLAGRNAMKKIFLFSAAALFVLAIDRANAADLPGAPAYKAPADVVTPLYNWTGFYIGGHISESWAHTNSSTVDTTTGAAVSTGSENQSDFHGGGQIGYDYMMSSGFVVGILADISSGNSHSSTFSNHTDSSKTDVGGTVRGRVGYAFDNLLLYASGGWAWATGKATRTQTGTPLTGNTVVGTSETVNTDRSGWTVGAGLAWGFLPNWNVYGEYRYTDYQSNTLTFPIALRSTTNSTTANRIELGVNYKF